MSGLELTAASWAEIAAAFSLAGAAIVVLYLVRLRRRVVVVPFVALFREALPDERTTRLFTRLKNVLSLLLVLLVAALIALALGVPRLREERSEPRTVILVVDATASMQARLGGGELDAARGAGSATRFDRARDAVLARIEELGEHERAIVLAFGAHAEVVHPLTTDHALLARAVRALAPSDAPGDADEALAWASSLCARDGEGSGAAEGAPHPGTCVVEIYSDGVLTGLAESVGRLVADGTDARLHLVEGEEARNIGITALSARRFPADPSRAELLVEVTSFDVVARRVTLTIAADGQLAHREVIDLGPGASVRRTLDELTGADALFEARIVAAGAGGASPDASSEPEVLDALAVDDVAWARLAPRRRRRALVVSPEMRANVYLEAALLLDPYLDVATVSPEAYEASGPPADREMVIFDGHTPAAPPPRPSLHLAPGAPAREWLPVTAPIERPHFDTQRREHPLLAFVALGDVNVATAAPILPAPGDETIAGDSRGALLVTGVREGQRFVALAFDVRASDLPLRIAWPILVLDAVAYLLPDDVTLAPSARTGRPFRLAVGEGEGALRRRGAPVDEVPILVEGRQGVAHVELDRVGVYDLTADPAEETERVGGRLVVANLFDRAESSLAAAQVPGAVPVEPSAGSVARSVDEDADRSTSWPLHVLLVAIALALLAIEWTTFHRRWTT